MSIPAAYCKLKVMRLPLDPPESPVLRAPAEPVTELSSVAALVADLKDTMLAEGGVGLAAPQVGAGFRLFVTGVAKDYKVFVNPKIIASSKEIISWEEGCLSLPRLLGEVIRPKRVTVRAQDHQGKVFEVVADGLFSRVLQHEYDHLEGILFPDRMTDLSKLKRITEEEWNSRFEDRSREAANG